MALAIMNKILIYKLVIDLVLALIRSDRFRQKQGYIENLRPEPI